ncbi:DUF6193 family natural product biosynthesis protein [Micromonospora sp. CPCC 206171]|uniref:DUF6193 family natural product biosynthesis protein n=1 Tax=Micromonospora sp. CPCC 206171 TaxID=3122405 RepID=UPI003FA533F3
MNAGRRSRSNGVCFLRARRIWCDRPSKRPQVNRYCGGLFPFQSLNTLRFSRCTGYPYSADVPHIEPTYGNRFRVVAPGGTLVAEGVNARKAAAVVASTLPPGFRSAVAGTARDLA